MKKYQRANKTALLKNILLPLARADLFTSIANFSVSILLYYLTLGVAPTAVINLFLIATIITSNALQTTLKWPIAQATSNRTGCEALRVALVSFAAWTVLLTVSMMLLGVSWKSFRTCVLFSLYLSSAAFISLGVMVSWDEFRFHAASVAIDETWIIPSPLKSSSSATGNPGHLLVPNQSSQEWKSGLHTLTEAEKKIFIQLVCIPITTCLVGAWLGSAVLPLDWSVNFLFYPFPHFVGGLFGHLVGAAIAYLTVHTLLKETSTKSNNKRKG